MFNDDADTNLYSAWSIDLSDFEDPVVNGLVTPSTSVISSFSSSTEFNFSYSAGQAEFNLGFATFDPGFTGVPLTDAGGSVPGFAGEKDIPNFTSWNTGLLPSVASTAPEPMSAVLVLISGFGLFACCKWCFRTWAESLSGQLPARCWVASLEQLKISASTSPTGINAQSVTKILDRGVSPPKSGKERRRDYSEPSGRRARGPAHDQTRLRLSRGDLLP